MIRTGTILHRRHGTKSFWYTVFFPGDTIRDCNTRCGTLQPFDVLEMQLDLAGDTCFLRDYEYTARSPLHNAPDRIYVVSYFSKLLRHLTEAAAPEQTLITNMRAVLKKATITTDDIRNVERQYLAVSGIPISDAPFRDLTTYLETSFPEREIIMNRGTEEQRNSHDSTDII